MLNYVWLGLIILGIGSAVTIDIMNQSQNKFKNDEPLPVTIVFHQPFKKNIDKSYDVNLKISSKNFNALYERQHKSRLPFTRKDFLSKKR